jgi:hypothetical protein
MIKIERNLMLRIMKVLAKILVAACTLLFFLYEGIGYWVDQQSIPASPKSAMFPKMATAVYSRAPKFYSEREIKNVIKLGNIVSIASLTEQSLHDMVDTAGVGFRLLDNYLQHRPSNMDPEAVAALEVERAILLNRMTGLVYPSEFGQRQDVFDSLERSAALTPDGETKIAAMRELMIHQYLDSKASHASREKAAERLDSTTLLYAGNDEHIVSANLYYKGLLSCIAESGDGASLMVDALSRIRDNRELVYLVTRNFDAPLIAVAVKQSKCTEELNSLKKHIGDNHG